MTIYRAVIFSAVQLREWAGKDFSQRRQGRARRQRNLAQIGEWVGVPVGLVVDTEAIESRVLPPVPVTLAGIVVLVGWLSLMRWAGGAL